MASMAVSWWPPFALMVVIRWLPLDGRGRVRLDVEAASQDVASTVAVVAAVASGGVVGQEGGGGGGREGDWERVDRVRDGERFGYGYFVVWESSRNCLCVVH